MKQQEILPLTQQDVIKIAEDSLSVTDQTFMITLTNTVTFLKFAIHLVLGISIGVLYYGVGHQASFAMTNAWCIFMAIAFGALAALIPSILTR